MTRAARALRAVGGVRLLAAGLLALQVVWIFAVPPFRGVDEFDHAYKASAVADGQWAPEPAAATRGTGAWLDVPRHLVAAANPECSALLYTKPHDCVGTRIDDDTDRVASGAGRYHPVFYALVGTPAERFDGATSLYVMRAAAALVCWAFFVLALAATRCWARTRWPYLALVVATTPVVAYTTVLPAPNGAEITSAMALWCALLGLATRRDPSLDGRLLVIGTVSAATLVTLRSFGPLWCVLIALTVLVTVRVERPRLRQVVLGSRGWLAMLVVLGATMASLVWIRSMGSLVVGTNPSPLSPLTKLGTTARELLLWLFQSIAAFPTRNEQTHPAVYGLYLIVFLTLVVAAYRVSSGRARAGLVMAALASAVVPAAVTFSTLETYGTAWQGRYTLPYAVGIVLVAGLLLDRAAPRGRTDVLVVGGAFYVTCQVVSPVLVAVHERSTSPGVDNGAWVLLPPIVLALLGVAGASALWWAAVRMPDLVEPMHDHASPTEEVLRDRSHRSGVTVGADR